jgi:hypothetical protein
MKCIDIKLSLPLVAPLIDELKRASEGLDGALAAPLRMPDLDPDFHEIWTDELVALQESEVKLLLGLFDDSFFSTGVIRIDETQAEELLRASTALRLKLRGTRLAGFSDEVLESGSVSPDQMPEDSRQGLLCYIFLATLQELVIRHFFT